RYGARNFSGGRELERGRAETSTTFPLPATLIDRHALAHRVSPDTTRALWRGPSACPTADADQPVLIRRRRTARSRHPVISFAFKCPTPSVDDAGPSSVWIHFTFPLPNTPPPAGAGGGEW